jgi:hypothetical protein
VDAKERNNINLRRRYFFLIKLKKVSKKFWTFFLLRQGDFDRIYAEIKNKLKSSRITNSEELRQMFLRYDSDRSGFISRENIKDLFRQISLPLDDDIINTVLIIIIYF